MANNKVQLANGTVLIDLTDTTATASDVASGSYFYDAAGVKQAGTLTVDQTYSVTKSLTNVTTTVDDTKVIAGNSFFMDLTPNTGYSIRNITVTMGGVDITDQVFTPGVGERTIVSNGTYTASTEGMSGYSSVTVNVPSESADLGTKAITANGTYNASSDNLDGYSQVAVNVANSYSASDEGKVVSSGALVTQTSDTVTENGTVDTTLINSLTVNVSGGSSPTGTKQISITENGTVTEDVTDYANVEITTNVSGGGSELSDFVLLKEFNNISGTNSVSYALPTNAVSFGSVFIVMENVTHASDWVYTQFTSSGAGFYAPKSTTDDRSYWVYFSSEQTIGGKTAAALYNVPNQTKSSGASVVRKSNTIRIYLYSSSNNFTGGAIKIYGRTVS